MHRFRSLALLAALLAACSSPPPGLTPTPTPASSLAVAPAGARVDTVGWRYTDSTATGWRYTDSLPVLDTVPLPGGPVAAYTWSCVDMACTFDGSASSGGTRFRWTNGNGVEMATTPTWARTFREAMTLTITLTVCSSATACDSVSHAVTTGPVTPPPVDSTPPDTTPPPPPVDSTPPPPPIDSTPAPPPGGNTHEPPGLRPIINITFGASKLPVGWVRAPQPTYGLTLGQAEAENSTRVSVGRTGAANDYAHRCLFPKNNNVQAGKGVGCTLYLKESDPGNTDGVTKHSYRIWYERGYVRWGNLDAAGNILGVFESASPTGLKLMGYWGVGCVGNINSTQIIGWMAPQPRNSTGQGFPVANWTFEWRSQVCGPTDWPFYSNVVLHPGPAWHKYEVLIDAGDVGQANGQISFWYDDQLLISRSVNMRTPANPRGVTGHHWNPVQGGGCGIRDPRCGRDNAGVLDIDDVYVSVGSPVD